LAGTFRVAALALFSASVLVGWAARASAVAVGTCAVVALVSLSVDAERAPRPGELARRESAYQSLRVVEREEGGERLRFLQVNEGFDSFQSAWQPEPGPLPTGYYYNDFLLPLAWRDSAQEWRLLVLGLGAGTVARVFAGEAELRWSWTGVELDPGVIALGREWLDLATAERNGEVWGGLDARLALRVARGQFDEIILDCYSNQVEIPAHLCTREFFAEAEARLAVGGWLAANLGGFAFDDPVVATVARTCARAFGSPVLLVRVPSSRNFMLFARRTAALPIGPQGFLPPTATTRLALGPRALPDFTRLVSQDEVGLILTDDHCPIEVLQQRSILEARARRAREEGA
jgi:spermidine synthase